MDLKHIPNIRLTNQQLTHSAFKTPKELVTYMGAIQAQDQDMCKWAVGCRLPGSTRQMIDDSLDKGDILRIHVLRPTWHLISRDDIYWMLQLTSNQIKAAMRSNDKKLGLTEVQFAQSHKLIEKALAGNKHLTRDELMAGFKDAKIAINENRASHFLLRAEVDGLICSGKKSGIHQTYTLLQELIPKPSEINKDEALAKLATTYFKSRGPATLNDFVWWSGLSITDARQALQMANDELIAQTIGTETYWLPHSFSNPRVLKPSVYLLPAFDEYLIAYADRNAAIASHHQPHAFSNNGIFRPVIVVNGKVAGIWKRTASKDKVTIVPYFLKPPSKQTLALMQKAAKAYGKFMDKPISSTQSL